MKMRSLCLLLVPALFAAEIAWPQREGAPRVHAVDAPIPYSFAAEMAARGDQAPVRFDLRFDKTDLLEVIDRFAFLLGDGTGDKKPVSYILHSDVKGEVTMQIQRTFARQQAWNVFEHVLYTQGSCCLLKDGVLHILPMAVAPLHPDSKPTFVKDHS
jgi:type II secretory pathway component GspD/PulD (secretin)